MNIDFSNDPGFSTYVVLLMLSGVLMLSLSGTRGSTRGLRLLNVAFGLGFLGYGFYLAALFQGGSYIIFFKAFIVPLVMAVKTGKAWLAQRSVPTAAPAPAPAMPTPEPAATAD